MAWSWVMLPPSVWPCSWCFTFLPCKAIAFWLAPLLWPLSSPAISLLLLLFQRILFLCAKAPATFLCFFPHLPFFSSTISFLLTRALPFLRVLSYQLAPLFLTKSDWSHQITILCQTLFPTFSSSYSSTYSCAHLLNHSLVWYLRYSDLANFSASCNLFSTVFLSLVACWKMDTCLVLIRLCFSEFLFILFARCHLTSVTFRTIVFSPTFICTLS
jgi:hypothetical protein